jgi:oligosaccharyltransferase complex subunit alpha (ribophorin I)
MLILCASNVVYYRSYPALESTIGTHVTYLDTIGRPSLTLKYKNLTDKHAGGVIYVSILYDYRDVNSTD